MSAEKLPRAPALYAIIVFKLLKGAFFLSVAFGLYSLSDNDLPIELHKALNWFHLDPEKKFFSELAVNLKNVTPNSMLWLASGSFLYGTFAFVEGIGLSFRASWAGWLSIGQSAFFIPIEIFELIHKFHVGLLVVMLINVFIVEYLFRNRATLFHHHAHPGGKVEKSVGKSD
ncbi:MAG TPA: DUF2127 domain-containing protein [Candidatus Limnocylindria bacterium]|jgi:uncharacterized membrane protein (DUF2068 family)|nr:DUF2127 domain-containing protein [Candidatus Limnocylindria bacterium]